MLTGVVKAWEISGSVSVDGASGVPRHSRGFQCSVTGLPLRADDQHTAYPAVDFKLRLVFLDKANELLTEW